MDRKIVNKIVFKAIGVFAPVGELVERKHNKKTGEVEVIIRKYNKDIIAKINVDSSKNVTVECEMEDKKQLLIEKINEILGDLHRN